MNVECAESVQKLCNSIENTKQFHTNEINKIADCIEFGGERKKKITKKLGNIVQWPRDERRRIMHQLSNSFQIAHPFGAICIIK